MFCPYFIQIIYSFLLMHRSGLNILEMSSLLLKIISLFRFAFPHSVVSSDETFSNLLIFTFLIRAFWGVPLRNLCQSQGHENISGMILDTLSFYLASQSSISLKLTN